jgi:acetyl-CoA carboxylase biotin carboxyl carrier protein
MSTSDQDQPQGHEQEQTRGGAQPGTQEGGAERAAGRQGGGGGGRGGRRRGGGGGGGGRAPQQQHGQQQQRRSESSLNMDELRELTELFTAHGLTDFEFENADIRVRLSRNPSPQAGATPAATPAPTATQAASQASPSSGAAAAPAAQAAPAEASQDSQAAAEAAEDLHIITSPIVGTFYRAPSPQAEVFVRAGSRVEPDTVVCIIEAMKLMNEIQAETTGTVVKIYVENGQPVEYGQPLFGIKK